MYTLSSYKCQGKTLTSKSKPPVNLLLTLFMYVSQALNS